MKELIVAFLIVVLILLLMHGSSGSGPDTMDHPDIIIVLAPLRQQAAEAQANAMTLVDEVEKTNAEAGDAGTEHMHHQVHEVVEHANNAIDEANKATEVLNVAENAAKNALDNGASGKDAAEAAKRAANTVSGTLMNTGDAYGGGYAQNVLNGSGPYKSYDNCMSYCGRCNAYSTEPILREMTFYNNLYDKEHSYECDPVVQKEFQRIYAAW